MADLFSQLGFGRGFAPPGYAMPQGPFERKLKCYSIMMLAGKAREEANNGGKSMTYSRRPLTCQTDPVVLVFLPPDALEQLAHLNVQYPMQFQLQNDRTASITHAGVLEFVAEPGRVYLPAWVRCLNHAAMPPTAWWCVLARLQLSCLAGTCVG